MALVSHAATLESRVPFLHFFDGFRTSHEVNKIEQLSDDDLRAMIDRELDCRPIDAARWIPIARCCAARPKTRMCSFKPARPAICFTMPCRRSCRRRWIDSRRSPAAVISLFDYVGAPDAQRVIVMMGSGAGAVEETVEALHRRGEKVGLVKVRLYRPFASEAFIAALPKTVRRIAVLDRTKEPGAIGRAALSGCRHGAG